MGVLKAYMYVQFATVTRFNPSKGWGFAQIEGTTVSALVCSNGRRRLGRDEQGVLRPMVRCGYHHPREGARLVVEVRQKAEDGKVKAIAWALREEWDKAWSEETGSFLEPQAPQIDAIATPPLVVMPVAAALLPALVAKEDPPLGFAEMIDVLGFKFAHAILDPMEKGELTHRQLRAFVRNPPKGKRGDALWKIFHTRSANSRKKGYGIAAFIAEILEESGLMIEA